jgi:hypothetical protein
VSWLAANSGILLASASRYRTSPASRRLRPPPATTGFVIDSSVVAQAWQRDPRLLC